jgi:hypothetical protein
MVQEHERNLLYLGNGDGGAAGIMRKDFCDHRIFTIDI